jgi:hypothetical protein
VPRWKVEDLRKIVLFVVIGFLCLGGVALAAWGVTSDGGNENAEVSNAEEGSFTTLLEEATASDTQDGTSEDGSSPDSQETTGEDAEASGKSGEDYSYTSPEQRYVTETQRHQNFFKAVAEGRVRMLQVTSVDCRPVGDEDTSYVYFTLISDSGTSSATMVFKFADGMWRIAAINQLQGDLEGGTNYMVPASFEDDLAREIAELQPFLTKVAEGRFSYMTVDSVYRPGENESVLTGVVVGKSGRTVPAEMRLRRDYGIWHLTYITNPP